MTATAFVEQESSSEQLAACEPTNAAGRGSGIAGEVRRIPLTADLPLEHPDVLEIWDQLFAQDRGARAFQHSHYVRTELELLSADERHLPVALSSQQPDGTTTALAILLPKTRWLTGPARLFARGPLYGYRLAGNRFLGSSDAETERQLLDAALAEVRRAGRDFLQIEDLEQGTPLFEAVQQRQLAGDIVYSPTSVQPRLRMAFPEDPLQYWSQFSGKTRYNYRRKQKNFPEGRVKKFTRPEEVAELLALGSTISARSWQGQHLGLRITQTPEDHRLYTALAECGFLRAYVLLKGTRPVAFLVGNQVYGTFYYEEVGYDQEFSSLSPGTVLLMYVLDDLLSLDTPRWFDFGGGDAEYKRIFANHHSSSGNVWIMHRSWRSVGVTCLLKTMQSARHFGRRVIASCGVDGALRRWLRTMSQRSLLFSRKPPQRPGQHETEQHKKEQHETAS